MSVKVFSSKFVRPLGFFSRLKLAHASTIGTLGALCVWNGYDTSSADALMFLAGTVLSTGAMWGSSLFTRTLVGQIAVCPDDHTVTLSHLTFWGKRNNVVVPIEAIMVGHGSANGQGGAGVPMAIPVSVDFGSTWPFRLVVHHSQVHDPTLFQKLVSGELANERITKHQ